jgi:tetratricopeptide (TPR) repeat protein
MKNKFAILISASLLSVAAFAQKDELKTLKKIYDKDTPSDKDIAEYKAAVAKAETYLATASEADKVYINYFKAKAPLLELTALMSKPENQTKPQLALQFLTPERITQLTTAYNSVREYEKTSGKMLYTKDINESVAFISPTLLNYAVSLGSQKKYKEGATVLYNLYLLDKKNGDNLYYAASYAVNAQDYDTALKYYDELKTIKYSGEGTNYLATSVASGKEEPFNNKADRDKMISLKTHTNPREEKIPSKRGEIYKNIALILTQNNKTDEAKAAFAEAIRENPEDISLMTSEADLYLKLKEYDTYKQKVAKILEKSPNDADLVYNIGVITMEGGQLAEAETFFKKALAINPNHLNANLNMSVIKLKGDEKLVTEMNKLTTSEKDNKRYDVLKKEREALFRNAMPYLEKAHEIDPANDAVISNLLSVYNFLEMTDKYKALKAKRTN